MEGISKSFSGQQVLYGVNFDLRAGETHVLAGENGAGKSTLIKILAGVHPDYEGVIRISGEPAQPRTPTGAAALGVTVIYQELSLIPYMSVTDNIFLGRERHGRFGWMRFREQERQCRAILERLGLTEIDPHTPVSALPLAAQQTVEIAKALAFDARIIVMDEPTSALSDPEVERLFAQIASLKDSGCGVIYITHKMDEIYRIADRITVLRDGEYIGTAAPDELPRPDLVKWMVGRTLSEQFPETGGGSGAVRLQVNDFTLPAVNNPRNIIDGVSLEARAGEILGLGGLSGSGTSELLQALFGVYGRRAQGSVIIDGQPYTPLSPRHAIQAGLAMVTNDRKSKGLVLNMGVRENVTLATVPKYSPRGWLQPARERTCAEQHRDTLGIRMRDPEQPVETLSGGNQQKVLLGKWLETAPKALLLDEPTRGVDVGAKQEIYELMRRWAASGMAILLITSELPELLALSDRIQVLHRGRTTAVLGRSEAAQDNVMAAAMGEELT